MVSKSNPDEDPTKSFADPEKVYEISTQTFVESIFVTEPTAILYIILFHQRNLVMNQEEN